MSKITRLLFDVSQQGNPICKIWLNDADITKTSEAKIVGVGSKNQYLHFLKVGDDIEVQVNKKSSDFINIIVPEWFTNIYDNYKVSPDNNVKMVGSMLNNSFNNAVSSLEFHKNGEVTLISDGEAQELIDLYYDEKYGFVEKIKQSILKSKIVPKCIKNLIKLLDSETIKPSEVTEIQKFLKEELADVSIKVFGKNNLRIEKE